MNRLVYHSIHNIILLYASVHDSSWQMLMLRHIGIELVEILENCGAKLKWCELISCHLELNVTAFCLDTIWVSSARLFFVCLGSTQTKIVPSLDLLLSQKV